METIISLVLFFPILQSSVDLPLSVRQYWQISGASTSSSSLNIIHIQQEKKKTHPTKIVIFVLWPIFYRGAWQHQHSTVLFLSTFRGRAGGTPFYPSQHVVLLPQVYSLFRPGHKSWIWLATQRCGMTSDRSGARRSASSGGWIQSENCVDHKPANLECQKLKAFFG